MFLKSQNFVILSIMNTQASPSKQRIQRYLCALICLALLCFFPFVGLAEGETAAVTPDDVNATSFVLMDSATGVTLLSKEPQTRIYPASTTKVMTALILIENKPDLSETITVGQEVKELPSDATLMKLQPGETVSYQDLLYGLMLVSGNDAGAAIAIGLSGSIDGFAEVMNQKAQELGMTHTHFVNPHGLHDENHYTTAEDMAILLRAAMQNETFRTVFGTASYQRPATNKNANPPVMENSNRLISTKKGEQYHYPYAIGGKTGYTDPAQGCLVASAKKEDRELICVIMGDNSSQNYRRWADSIMLFNYGFDQTQVVDITNQVSSAILTQELAETETSPGGKMWVKPSLPEEKAYFVGSPSVASSLTAEGAQLTPVVTLAEGVTMDVEPGAKVGTMTFQLNDTVVYTCDAVFVADANEFDSLDENGVPIRTQNTRLYVIIVLSLALILVIFLLFRVITAPSRRRRNRRSHSQYSSRDIHKYELDQYGSVRRPQRQHTNAKRPASSSRSARRHSRPIHPSQQGPTHQTKRRPIKEPKKRPPRGW